MTPEQRKERIIALEARIKEIRGNKANHQLTLGDRLEIINLQAVIETHKLV